MNEKNNSSGKFPDHPKCARVRAFEIDEKYKQEYLEKSVQKCMLVLV